MNRKTLNKLKSFAAITTCGFGVFAGISIYKGDEKFYRDYLMPFTRLLPPEISHNLALLALKHKIFPIKNDNDPRALQTSFLGYSMKNPIGMAAGFDKQGEAVDGLFSLGFGFVEIGSVTPEPQSGNQKPRVFRLLADEAIINRYGFNSDGHETVFERLQDTLRKPNRVEGLLGINLGKNKTSENAIGDYVKGIEKFGPIADYLVINVSSPNTPGLRSMQHKEHLYELLSNVVKARNELQQTNKVPILLKLAPDLSLDERKDIVAILNKKECQIDGLIISNTTVARDGLISQEKDEIGGLSGRPLTNRSTQMIAEMYTMTKGRLPIIGVGGIFTGEDAMEKILAGASIVQLYTSFIYHGPPIVGRIKSELNELLIAKGYKNVQEAVGKEANKFIHKK